MRTSENSVMAKFSIAPPLRDLAVKCGFCRVYGEEIVLPYERSGARFSGCQHPRLQELEPRSSVSLSLQQLEFVDEAFHAAVAPLFRKARLDRGEILPQA